MRALVFDFLWDHAMMLRGWAERTEALLTQWETISPAERAEAALAIFRSKLAADASGTTDERTRPSARKHP